MKQSMECEGIEELLPLYIDGELSTDDSAALSLHLAGCAACMHSLETYQALESSLSSMSDILPDPRAVSSTVTGHLGLEEHKSVAGIFRRMSLVWAFAVTTAALILLISRFDYVSALMSGQEALIGSAGRMMNYWTAASSGMIADIFNQIDATMSSDPWILAMGMIGFGLVIFTAGMAAVLKTLR